MASFSKISFLFIAVMFTYLVYDLGDWEKKDMLGWDETGYYLYLPASFIYHDVGDLQFDSVITNKYGLNSGWQWYAIFNQPRTGHKLNKYAVGTSVFELPFFFLAHLYCTQVKSSPADGYSDPYRFCIAFGYVFWTLVGLYFLRKFLQQYFMEAVTGVTLLIIAFGTNLYFYTVLDRGMSHPLSFTLFCLELYATDNWYRTGRHAFVILLGAVLGMILITRPTNIIVAIVPLLWPLGAATGQHRLEFFKKKAAGISLAVVAFFAVAMIQCSYWKYVTGHWIHFSYEDEGFNFLSPKIWKGLFSYRKGWFVYTPVAFLAMFGFIPLFRRNKRIALVSGIVLILAIYIVFCWCSWYYGGSFGCRALIEYLALVSLPLAALYQWIFSGKKIVAGILLSAAFGFCIWLNLFQSYQLHEHKIPWDNINRAYYWRTFGHFNTSMDDQKLMQQ